MEQSELLKQIVQRRQRSIVKQFVGNPLKVINDRPSVFYAITIFFAAVVAVFLLYTGTNPVQVIVFALLLAIMPAGFFDFYKRTKVKMMELEFPSLLRDIAIAAKSGMNLDSSVRLCAMGQYGALTPAIRHIDYLMSWGTSFEEALLYLAKKYPAPLIRRSVSTIIEAARTGGEIGPTMENVAVDAQELKALEARRGAETQPYVMVIYVSYFVFLMVVSIISYFLIPQLQEVSKQIEGRDLGGLILRVTQEDVELYQQLFFHGLIVQGFFGGVVAGKMGGGTILAGLKHSAIFVALAFVSNVILF